MSDKGKEVGVVRYEAGDFRSVLPVNSETREIDEDKISPAGIIQLYRNAIRKVNDGFHRDMVEQIRLLLVIVPDFLMPVLMRQIEELDERIVEEGKRSLVGRLLWGKVGALTVASEKLVERVSEIAQLQSSLRESLKEAILSESDLPDEVVFADNIVDVKIEAAVLMLYEYVVEIVGDIKEVDELPRSEVTGSGPAREVLLNYEKLKSYKPLVDARLREFLGAAGSVLSSTTVDLINRMLDFELVDQTDEPYLASVAYGGMARALIPELESYIKPLLKVRDGYVAERMKPYLQPVDQLSLADSS